MNYKFSFLCLLECINRFKFSIQSKRRHTHTVTQWTRIDLLSLEWKWFYTISHRIQAKSWKFLDVDDNAETKYASRTIFAYTISRRHNLYFLSRAHHVRHQSRSSPRAFQLLLFFSILRFYWHLIACIYIKINFFVLQLFCTKRTRRTTLFCAVVFSSFEFRISSFPWRAINSIYNTFFVYVFVWR